ncbi:phosphonate metabolism protein/1,5-bisphosphokinase (PRPP-forming) PhnN [Peteryoungia ipomoeae]|uniref:Ribose 1,5-bisphosphate phosphokinase PhnN n=1 Tax=Peteryoungia ipomoeae TaxID=1210932 RepID=A0A4S8P3Q0_9HYPH|nr:phosphonate metabolism protein/1,5-bisphosphokinase (PRPP-forming) PhnN [Peteryoungia ipomoeae]THV22299.1 phosphonate metabolism protein/1,5-bisphosphokinase (PRPP-forming) PhnN [Peteryoungia ipomoeae]
MPDRERRRHPDLEHENAGTLIVVVGPSGVGKDSLIAVARRHFRDDPDIRFVQRVITRPADSGGEDHRPASMDAFTKAKSAGDFAIDWEAHGLRYGVPISILADLRSGATLVVNGSRSALPQFEERFAKLVVVNVTARPDALAARLAARGRETAAEIEARLNRTTEPPPSGAHVVTINNSGALEAGAQKLIDLIGRLAHQTA